jgi:hypothetical protein
MPLVSASMRGALVAIFPLIRASAEAWAADELEIRTGKTLTSDSPEAVNLYQKAVDLILGSQSGAAETLDKALELDQDFALAAASGDKNFTEKLLRKS